MTADEELEGDEYIVFSPYILRNEKEERERPKKKECPTCGAPLKWFNLTCKYYCRNCKKLYGPEEVEI